MMSGPGRSKALLTNPGIVVALLGLLTLVGYSLFGHVVLRAIYGSGFLTTLVMKARATTPLEFYLVSIDETVLFLGVLLIGAGFLVALVAKNPIGVVMSAATLLAGTFGIFLFLEFFPNFIEPLHFDGLPYFERKLSYNYDPVLGFRERPLQNATVSNFRGSSFSPLYGIDVEPSSIVWQTDREGFRNRPEVDDFQIAVVGSSFVEYGNDFDDTYPGRLEKHLGGTKVVNLAKAGYGPFQYMNVVKRYVLDRKPQFVLFTFYPISDTESHLSRWVNGGPEMGAEWQKVVFGGLLSRYTGAMREVVNMVAGGIWTNLRLGFNRITPEKFIHPDVVVLRIEDDKFHKVVFPDQHSPASADALLASPEWAAEEMLLTELKSLAEAKGIVPVVIYVPAATEIYSQYSTAESGVHWLNVRDQMVASSSNSETAARLLAARVGVRLVNLRPAFLEAASRGVLLYYPMDRHWNENGREVAAKVTAEALRAIPPGKSSPPREAAPSLNAPAQARSGTIVRNIDGTIKSWDRNAEELYGWRMDEAVGKSSHRLLQTHFPESLADIDATLRQKGQWDGKLLHTTRDGRQVVVASHWTLTDNGLGEVIEVNSQSPKF